MWISLNHLWISTNHLWISTNAFMEIHNWRCISGYPNFDFWIATIHNVDIHNCIYGDLQLELSISTNHSWRFTMHIWISTIRIVDNHIYICGYQRIHLWRSAIRNNYGYPQMWIVYIHNYLLRSIINSWRSIIHL